MNKNLMTLKELKEFLKYNPKTGKFYWTQKFCRRINAGQLAGTIMGNGYNMIVLKGVHYTGHWLAWLFIHDEWPKNQIDHINGIRSDNRIKNLRSVTCRQNLCNKKIHRDGKLPGSSYEKSSNKWRVQFWVKGKRIDGGRFKTELDAYKAYKKKLKEFGEEI